MRIETWLGPAVLKAGFEPSRLDGNLRNFALTLWDQPGLSRSNRGGWHSRYLDISDADDAGNATVLSELAQRVQDVAALFLQKWTPPKSQLWRETRASRVRFAALWVNVHEAGDYNVEHQHAEIGAVGDDIPLLSGVYYPEGPSGGAKLHFAACDEVPAEVVESPSCSVDADAGTMVVFPATLPHGVEPGHSFRTGVPRVSFAFNLIVRKAASKLHTAVMIGNLFGTSQLLDEADADVNAKDPAEGFTPLHYAAEAGHVSALHLLLKHGADPFALSERQSLPVHLAAEAGELNAVRDLLTAAPGLARSASGSQNRMLVHIAAANGQIDLLKELHNFDTDFRSVQGDGGNALHASVQNGHLAATELILQQVPGLVNESDAAGHRPSHEAARGGHTAILSSLLQARGDVTGKGQDSLVYWAAHGGHTAVLSLLMSKVTLSVQRDVDRKSSSTKGEAVANYLAAALIGSGSSPQMNAEELSPMHVAAQAGHSKVAAWLQREGLSVAEPASSQMQPIHLAASNGHLEVTDWLLQQDTNLATATARGGITPLHMAALNGRPEAIDGSQPLHVAAAGGHTEVAKVLLNARASVDASTRKRLLPIDRAREAGHALMVELLSNLKEQKIQKDQEL